MKVQVRELAPLRCAYCHDRLAVEAVLCFGCRTLIHADCQADLALCVTAGCGSLEPWEWVDVARDPAGGSPGRPRRPARAVALVVALAVALGAGWVGWSGVAATGPPARGPEVATLEPSSPHAELSVAAGSALPRAAAQREARTAPPGGAAAGPEARTPCGGAETGGQFAGCLGDAWGPVDRGAGARATDDRPPAARPARSARPDALLRSLAGGDPDERATAAVAAAERGLVAAVPALVAMLGDPREEPRKLAAWALGTLGPAAAPATAQLADLLLHDPDEYVRVNAAAALGAVGEVSGQGLDAAREASRSDPSASVRVSAYGVLVAAAGSAEAPLALQPELDAALAGEAWVEGALGGLARWARLEDPRLVAALGRIAVGDFPMSRRQEPLRPEAIAVLGASAGPAAAPALAQLLDLAGARSPRLHAAAEDAIRRIGVPDRAAFDVLVDALHGGSCARRWRARVALARAGDAWAGELVRLLQASEPGADVQRELMAALRGVDVDVLAREAERLVPLALAILAEEAPHQQPCGHAVRLLERVAPRLDARWAAAAVPTLLRLAADDGEPEGLRRVALHAVGAFGPAAAPHALPALVARLATAEGSVLVATVAALGGIGDGAAAGPLLRLAQRTQAGAREPLLPALAAALGATGSRANGAISTEVESFLSELHAASPYPAVRRAAGASLAALREAPNEQRPP